MQAKEGGQNFLHGALILAASALIVKLIGAFFKVPALPISSAAPVWAIS